MCPESASNGKRAHLLAGLILACLVIGAPAHGEAQEEQPYGLIGLSSGELRQLCTDGSPSCRAYVSGVVDTAILNHLLFTGERDRGFAGPGRLGFCFPPDVALADPVQIFTSHLEARPEAGAYSAAEGVLQALASRYPCPAPEDR